MAAPGSVWVTGAGGFVGTAIVQAARAYAPTSKIIPLTRSELDLTDFNAVTERFRVDRPNVIVHCAAMARSVACHADPSGALKINIDATAHLAGLASNSALILFSSDLVFDGRKGNYVETDEPNPLSVYAETKLAAEKIVLANPRHTVARCSLIAGVSPKGIHSFNEELVAAWESGKTTKLFYDEFRTPIAAPLVARAVWEIATCGLTGLFHLAGAEKLSRVQIGELIAARHPEVVARIEPCSLREYQGPPRPADCSLNCAKLQNRLSFSLAGLNDWLQQHPDARI